MKEIVFMFLFGVRGSRFLRAGEWSNQRKEILKIKHLQIKREMEEGLKKKILDHFSFNDLFSSLKNKNNKTRKRRERSECDPPQLFPT
mmetsp:Transcript_22156/g.30446  ORF Transcript_22156/g.30446 Transcript_22156/m.30446 type:complete len:88 (+) Transcript_22156:419-682(+)